MTGAARSRPKLRDAFTHFFSPQTEKRIFVFLFLLENARLSLRKSPLAQLKNCLQYRMSENNVKRYVRRNNARAVK
jgi:hypothetical protein